MFYQPRAMPMGVQGYSRLQEPEPFIPPDPDAPQARANKKKKKKKKKHHHGYQQQQQQRQEEGPHPRVWIHFTCASCRERYRSHEGATVPQCEHRICWDCFKGHIENAIDEEALPIKCPAMGCSLVMEEGFLESTLERLPVPISPRLADAYVAWKHEQEGTVIRCPDCHQRVIVGPELQGERVVACGGCKCVWCRTCNARPQPRWQPKERRKSNGKPRYFLECSNPDCKRVIPSPGGTFVFCGGLCGDLWCEPCHSQRMASGEYRNHRCERVRCRRCKKWLKLSTEMPNDKVIMCRGCDYIWCRVCGAYVHVKEGGPSHYCEEDGKVVCPKCRKWQMNVDPTAIRGLIIQCFEEPCRHSWCGNCSRHHATQGEEH